MTVHPSDLLRYLGTSQVIRLGSDRAEVRSLSFIVMSFLLYQLVEPGVYIVFVRDSITHKVAGLTYAPLLAAGYFISAALVLPHLLALAFAPGLLACRAPRKLAAVGAFMGAILWGTLALLSAPLDFDWVTPVYIARAMFDLWIAVLMGISLNAQQARLKAEDLARDGTAAEAQGGADVGR
ncbi:hypothetical protein [Variovorax sp. LT1R16]|uniref:hypothetical protein n=1 Tax=Variovorax sp. LT1R16 TaxID=3443728 RepID=UPI003F46E1A6